MTPGEAGPHAEPYRPDFILPPQPYIVRPPAPPPPPVAKRRVWWRVAPLIGLVVALAVPAAVFARRVTSTPTSAAAQAISTKASPTGTIDARIRAALDRQSQALLAGDEAGFVAPAEPSNAALRAHLSRRFASLRAMRVATYRIEPTGLANRTSDTSWTLAVAIRLCFVVAECRPTQTRAETHWSARGGELWLTVFGPDGKYGPMPWEVSELRAAAGARAVVATTAAYQARLPAILAAAEQAGQRADQYAKWVEAPARYVVYLAGPDEWTTWFSTEATKWAAGYTTFVSRDVAHVVLNAERVPESFVLDALQHEFGHVVTLIGSSGRDTAWWLDEGIAEYVRMVGRSSYDRIADVRKFVRSGRWPGTVALDAPRDSTSRGDVSGYYGVAYLAVRRIADRFGEPKMLAFFDLVARQGTALDSAATSALGVGWSDVDADCVKYVRARI